MMIRMMMTMKTMIIMMIVVVVVVVVVVVTMIIMMTMMMTMTTILKLHSCCRLPALAAQMVHHDNAEPVVPKKQVVSVGGLPAGAKCCHIT